MKTVKFRNVYDGREYTMCCVWNVEDIYEYMSEIGDDPDDWEVEILEEV